MSSSEAKFRINVKEGVVELEGKEGFVDKHLDRFEEIFKTAIKEAMNQATDSQLSINQQQQQQLEQKPHAPSLPITTIELGPEIANSARNNINGGGKLNQNQNHSIRHISNKQSINIPPMPVDLKSNNDKIGLREFYTQKNPTNHYEKTTVFVYYLTKYNKKIDVHYGEILSCYEEVDEKKPSIIDIVKNSIRYKGWLEYGNEKFVTRLTISGDNYVKFDLPRQNRSHHQSTFQAVDSHPNVDVPALTQ